MMELLKLLDIKSGDRLGAIQEVGQYFIKKGYKIIDLDVSRPWGFYFYFDPSQTKKFIEGFFDGVELTGINSNLPLQPKVLVFEPGKQNSWQYHHRRAEIWRVITNLMRAVTSDNDEPAPEKIMKFGDVINFSQGSRHRGGATKYGWSAVAEIWQHADPNNPSDEQDIIRLADDFGRKSGN